VRLASLVALFVVGACTQQPIGLPAGSNNYDDPDDPGHPGIASGAPDASGDAYGRFCVSARDCPAAFVCAYAIADSCGAVGQCLPYTGYVTCDAGTACGCDGTDVLLCAPDGYAPNQAVQSTSPCAVTPDAGSDAATDAASE
jgi:hypothetical protein